MFAIDSKYLLYITETWTTQKESNAERRDSFILRSARFSVNNDRQ
jgi:hypothetical protein